MRKVKYCLEHLPFYDQQRIEQHLEDMAAQGWILEKIGPCLWKYRRATPQTLRFAVTYCADASVYDSQPTEKEQTLEEFCAAGGWHLMARWGQIQIFAADAPDAVPLETDAQTWVWNIQTAMQATQLPFYYKFAAFFGISLLLSLYHNLRANPIDALSSYFSLAEPFAILLLLLGLCGEILAYYSWQKRAFTAAQQGAFCPVRQNRRITRVFYWSGIVLLLGSFCRMYGMKLTMAVLLIVGALLLTQSVALWAGKKRGHSREANRRAVETAAVGTALLCLALVLALYPQPEGGDAYRSADGKAWVRQTGSSQGFAADDIYQTWGVETQDTEDLFYTRTVALKQPIWYCFCRDALLKNKSQPMNSAVDQWKPDDTALWGAQEVYRGYQKDGTALCQYLVCYPKQLIRVTAHKPVSDEKMAAFAQTLACEQP